MSEALKTTGEPMLQPEKVLKEVFGLPSFRGQQAEIIGHVVGGGDAVVLLPTGAGKSLCYQIPALCRDGVAVVVSPLIALMRDQVEALRQSGVRAAALNCRVMGGISLLPLVRFWRRRVYLRHIAKAKPGGISFFPFLCILHTFGFDV